MPLEGFAGCAADPGCVCGVDDIEQQDAAGLSPGNVEPEGAIEQQLGTTVFGAATPAMSEPRPSFCNVGASSLPFASRSFADWNFSSAATVFASSLPLGSPL